jgi:hypothetical protein
MYPPQVASPIVGLVVLFYFDDYGHPVVTAKMLFCPFRMELGISFFFFGSDLGNTICICATYNTHAAGGEARSPGQ